MNTTLTMQGLDPRPAPTVLRVAVDCELPAGTAVAQVAHAVSLAAARCGGAWEHTTIVVHSAGSELLAAVGDVCGARRGCSAAVGGAAAVAAVFAEVDLLWGWTAACAAEGTAAAALIAPAELWVPPAPAAAVWSRSWLRALAGDVRRRGIAPDELHALCAGDGGDPSRLADRVAAACRWARGKEPPMTL